MSELTSAPLRNARPTTPPCHSAAWLGSGASTATPTTTSAAAIDSGRVDLLPGSSLRTGPLFVCGITPRDARDVAENQFPVPARRPAEALLPSTASMP